MTAEKLSRRSKRLAMGRFGYLCTVYQLTRLDAPVVRYKHYGLHTLYWLLA
jgi:hypothetical protein